MARLCMLRRLSCAVITLWYDAALNRSHRFELDAVLLVDICSGCGRDNAMAWIDERQLGRRNVDDDKRAMVADDLVQRLSKIAVVEQCKIAGAAWLRLVRKPTKVLIRHFR